MRLNKNELERNGWETVSRQPLKQLQLCAAPLLFSKTVTDKQ